MLLHFLFWHIFNPIDAELHYSSPNCHLHHPPLLLLGNLECMDAKCVCVCGRWTAFFSTPTTCSRHLLLLREWRSDAHTCVVTMFSGGHWFIYPHSCNLLLEPFFSRHDKPMIALVDVSRLFVLMHREKEIVETLATVWIHSKRWKEMVF